MRALFVAAFVGVVVVQTSRCASGAGCCPDGTMRFKESCYRYERYITETFAQAAEHCAEINEYLWVPQDQEEFVSDFSFSFRTIAAIFKRAVLAHAQPGHITWIGGIAMQNESMKLDWAWADATAVDPEAWMCVLLLRIEVIHLQISAL